MDVIGIGLANMDLVAHVEDSFLKQHKIKKGLAQKLNDLEFARLRADLNHYEAVPGGCVANTLCGLASQGVSSRFYGKIGDDSFDSLYRASFREYEVAYDVAAGGQESSQCAVLVTPDGERSFAYTHGASWDLSPEDIDADSFSAAALIHIEIYIFEFGRNSDTAQKVFEAARTHQVPLVMKVMDQDFAVRYAQKVRALADAKILTLLIGNHENLPSLVGAGSIDETLLKLSEWPCDILMTANRDGAYFIRNGEVSHHPVRAVDHPKNTTGAGDQFTAGFLMGRLDGKPVEECMRFAAESARMILMHDTARPPLVNKHAIRF